MKNQRRRSALLLISVFVFDTWIVQFFYFINPEFPELVGNPEDRFYHVKAQLI